MVLTRRSPIPLQRSCSYVTCATHALYYSSDPSEFPPKSLFTWLYLSRTSSPLSTHCSIFLFNHRPLSLGFSHRKTLLSSLWSRFIIWKLQVSLRIQVHITPASPWASLKPDLYCISSADSLPDLPYFPPPLGAIPSHWTRCSPGSGVGRAIC